MNFKIAIGIHSNTLVFEEFNKSTCDVSTVTSFKASQYFHDKLRQGMKNVSQNS